jgi:glyoxylase-like metal-dependent hydrolase (beta-lactamase superfamily II)
LDKEFNSRYEKLERELTAIGVNSENLKLILLTHGDIDHVFNAAQIKAKYKTQTAISSGDLKLVNKPDLGEWMVSFNYRSFLYRAVFKIMDKSIRGAMQKTINNFTPFMPDFFLNDNDSLERFGIKAKVIHIPGHTRGSVAVLTHDGDLIAGDIFSNNKKPETAPNAADFEELKKSVSKLKKLPVKTVYPGHGTPFDFSLLRL